MNPAALRPGRELENGRIVSAKSSAPAICRRASSLMFDGLLRDLVKLQKRSKFLDNAL
jgi:hypothetical protein